MTDNPMNETIVSLIRAARNERGITQKELADHLGKTQATMSDLERGKVQVSASDLYQISLYLSKPIEYFYGEETGNKEIQDFVAILQSESSKDRISILKIAGMMVKMQALGEEAKRTPKGKELPIAKVKEFYDLFVPFSVSIKEMANKLDELREAFDKELKIRNINTSKK